MRNNNGPRFREDNVEELLRNAHRSVQSSENDDGYEMERLRQCLLLSLVVEDRTSISKARRV